MYPRLAMPATPQTMWAMRKAFAAGGRSDQVMNEWIPMARAALAAGR